MNQEFLNVIIPAAVKDEKKSQVPAEVTVGQSILESNWGQSQLATMAHNLFGIKASSDWDGDTINMYGSEYIGGTWYHHQLIKWRKYASVSESITDHSAFLHNTRYLNAFSMPTWELFIVAIHRDGYATDPHYAEKVIDTVSSHGILDQIKRERQHAASATA